ncbi:insecticidal delta-endotoxin Cry8Ea1 family protein [Bacillus thuringiensis]|uniref:insecticidal delta-endotoxin Cry8Ea1 family protein n=1 Tax=Bacillus thuringiensis TaxID=1428 RepID=UPI0020D24F42|nr:insecticidal delta-endotoxin Cry8Ea1 family protein [Bacillus thuringiensis]
MGKLWPADNSQWEEFMRHVEELVNTSIEVRARQQALDELTGLSNIVASYNRTLADWKLAQNDSQAKERVRDAFRTVNTFFEQRMPLFSSRNYEVPLLTVYALAANMHLLLLRDSSIFGIGWGFSQKEVNDNYCDQLRLANQYANHCTTWFNTGLHRLRGTNASSWIRYNRFRREMTLTVLDICSLFSKYDYYQYPKEVKSELTREIYTDPVGVSTSTVPGLIPNWFNHAPSFNELELALIRSPRTLTWLNKITISTGRLNGWSTSQNYWQGHRLEFSETSAGNNQPSPTYGTFNTSVAQHRDFNVLNRDVYTMDSYAVSQVFGTSTATLFGVSDNVFQYQDLNSNFPGTLNYTNPPSWGGLHIYSELPALPTTPGVEPGRPTANNYSHRLTYLTASRAGTAGHVLCCGWTSSTVDRNNRIDPNKITQIPAVKGYNLGSATVVVRGPGHTGGDLVKFDYFEGGLTINCYFPQPLNYRMRIRYSAPNNSAMYLNSSHVASVYIPFPRTNIIDNVLVDPMVYGAFQTVEVPARFRANNVGNATFTFRLQYSQNPIYIDKIEFIPDGTPIKKCTCKCVGIYCTLECTESRSLTTEKEIVNNLFIN